MYKRQIEDRQWGKHALPGHAAARCLGCPSARTPWQQQQASPPAAGMSMSHEACAISQSTAMHCKMPFNMSNVWCLPHQQCHFAHLWNAAPALFWSIKYLAVRLCTPSCVFVIDPSMHAGVASCPLWHCFTSPGDEHDTTAKIRFEYGTVYRNHC